MILYFKFSGSDNKLAHQRSPKKFRTVIIQHFIRKLLSKVIWTSGSAPTRKCMKVKVHIFQFGHFRWSKSSFDSSFLIKCYTISVLNLIFMCFGKYLKSQPNGFSIVISNLVQQGSGVYFQARKLINNPGVPESQIWILPFYRYSLALSKKMLTGLFFKETSQCGYFLLTILGTCLAKLQTQNINKHKYLSLTFCLLNMFVNCVSLL